MTIETVIQQLRIGGLQPLGEAGTLTGIFKREVEVAFVAETGLEQDEQGDQCHHGGPEKALHHFAADHYARLRERLPAAAAEHCHPGAFGENLVTEGFTETDVCVATPSSLAALLFRFPSRDNPAGA